MPKLDDFWIDGEMASAVGIMLQKEFSFEGAQPNVETVTVPGRNGDILYFDGSFSNVKGTASCFCVGKNATRVMTAINAWLMKSAEYRRLETLQEYDFFRLARLVRAGNMNARLGQVNEFTLEFDCKPQKFYKSGLDPVSFADDGSLINLTAFMALPLITVHGSAAEGSVTIGNKTLMFSNCNEITVDSEKMRAWHGSENASGMISGDFPVLGPGENQIQISGGVSSVEITPRWWTI